LGYGTIEGGKSCEIEGGDLGRAYTERKKRGDTQQTCERHPCGIKKKGPRPHRRKRRDLKKAKKKKINNNKRKGKKDVIPVKGGKLSIKLVAYKKREGNGGKGNPVKKRGRERSTVCARKKKCLRTKSRPCMPQGKKKKQGVRGGSLSAGEKGCECLSLKKKREE